MRKKLDKTKFGISLKPINMAIISYIQLHNTVTTKQIIEDNKEYAQASIYRAIKELLDVDIIAVEKQEKVHSVLERYFKLNYDVTASLDHDTDQEQYEDVVNAVNIWMSTITSEIYDYLNEWAQTNDAIRFGMGRELLHVSDENLMSFYRELHTLIKKYQNMPAKGDEKIYAFSASWVPIKKG